MKTAYIMSRFPKLTETFILYEILELERQGYEVEVYPLLKHPASVRHPEAERVVSEAFFHPLLSLPIVWAHIAFLFSCPLRYFSTLFSALKASRRSLNFFLGVMVYFPKAVWFARTMQARGVDHIHAHFANHPAMVAFVISKLVDLQYSFTAHGSDLHKDQTMLKEKVEASLFAVTVSDFNKEVMVSAAGEAVRQKIHVIHCGVDPSEFKPIPNRPAAGPIRLICVASFEEVKGHRFLVKACRILRDRGISVECRLIGEGPLRREIERQVAAEDLSTSVLFLGGQPRPQVVRELSSADIIVLPSVPTAEGKREGIPVALMEGMAVGLPAVSSRLSGIPELVKDGESGLLTEPGNSEALADALSRLAQSPELRAQMGAAGRRIIEQEFNHSVNVGQFSSLLESITKRRPKSH